MADNYIPIQKENTGLYVQQTPIFDVQAIYQTEVTDPEFKELLVRLYQQVNNVVMSLNLKDSALYLDQIFQCGQNWFPNPAINTTNYIPNNMLENRPVFRKVVNFGALPDTTSKSVAHDIPIDQYTIAGVNPFSFTRIYATASDPTGGAESYIPIPYASSNAADIIELSVDKDNVTITTASNKSAYTICYVVLEWIEE